MKKVVIVTGSSQGIGLGVVKVFLQNGYQVVSCSEKDISACPHSLKLQSLFPDDFYYVKADITNLHDIDNLVEKTVEHFGRIDAVVSNAGANVFKGVDCKVEDFEFNFNLNLRSHWYLAKRVRPYLEQNGGVILVMSSNHGYFTMPGYAPYNIVKRALQSLVQSITIEWGPKIRAVAIAPGFIDTEGNQAWFDSHEDPKKAREDTIKIHPVGRLGTPAEIGELCLFLSSDKAGFIAGTTILIDGGRSAVMQD